MALEERDGIVGKVCTKCKEWKPVERFSPRKASRDGYQSQSKPCNSAPNTTRQPIEIDGKVCTVCGEWKPATEYYRKRYSIDGYRSACNLCFQASSKYHRELDIEASRAKQRERYAEARPRRIAMRRIRIAARLEAHRAYIARPQAPIGLINGVEGGGNRQRHGQEWGLKCSLTKAADNAPSRSPPILRAA